MRSNKAIENKRYFLACFLLLLKEGTNLGNKIYHILLKGSCPLWVGTMRHVLACHSCCALMREADGALVSHIFCDLDTVSLSTLRSYKSQYFIRLCGFYTKKISLEKQACCDAVFKKNMPVHRVLSFLFHNQKGENSHVPNDIILIKALHHGLSDKQISFNLHVPVSTVKYHLRQLYKKLNVSNRTQAALAVREFIV